MNLQDIDASASPEVQINENFETLDHQSVYGKRQPVTTGLTWGYCGGRWGGNAITASTLTLTDSTTNYIVVNRGTGAISVSTTSTNWDNVAAYARVYKLTTAGGVVTATEDHRAGPWGVHGYSPPSVNVTAVGNVGVGEDDLMTYTLPAGLLATAKRGVKITAWGTFANNANVKRLKLYFGAVPILDTLFEVGFAGVWRVAAEVVSTGTDAQEAVAQLVTIASAGSPVSALNDLEVSNPNQDDGAAITIKCTGSATSNDDIRQRGMLVETF